MLFGDVELSRILMYSLISLAGDLVFAIMLLFAMSGLGDFIASWTSLRFCPLIINDSFLSLV